MFCWTCRAKLQATGVIRPFCLQREEESAIHRVRQQHAQCAGCTTTGSLKCCCPQGSSVATGCLLRSTPLPQAAALMADAGAVIGRLQAPALHGQDWRWQRQPAAQAPFSWQRAQQLLRITRSAPRTGCSRASCRQAGRHSPIAAAALAAVGLGVQGPF